MPNLFEEDQPELLPPPGAGWTYLRVAVERGIDRGGTEAALTYRSAVPVPLGHRVEVPLGRGNSAAAGIVVETGGPELCEGFSPEKAKSILRDVGVGLTPRLVDLARWISAYYVCPIGMVLAAMMPAAVKYQTGRVVRELIDRVESDVEASMVEIKLSKTVRQAWDSITALGREALPMDAHALAAKIGASNVGPVNRLIDAGLLRRIEREDVRSVGGAPEPALIEQKLDTAARVTLSSDQLAAVEGIGATLGEFGTHLLYGVTGSGKTEVYLRVLERVLQAGKSALVLVPEISLTPQTAGRFQSRFGSVGVAVLHSGLSASQRHAQWSAAANGKARVVVGARSAVFAPLQHLGIVVVDEEHASDYKQDQLPRYHGRDVAIKRAQLEGCPVVLGSATPSLESWQNTMGPDRRGRYSLWRLRDRVGGGRLPRVEVVDLREEWRVRASASIRAETRAAVPSRDHMLGPTLEQALGDTLRDGGQAILLLNRRGYSCYIACAQPKCGWVLTCDECDACMVEHRFRRGQAAGFVRCHHCLAQQKVPDQCPVCTGPVQLLGMGTQRVEEELQTKFGRLLAAAGVAEDRWLVRVDGDTMKTGREFHELLERFAAGEVRVLVGTQMIAKGLDFPNVRLVGVINADTALSLPDFRATERTFQLVAQVAGRAGRGELEGRVIVQTLEPDAPAIVHAARHDFEAFATEELRARADAALPPVTRMARIVCRDQDLAEANAAAEGIASALREVGAGHGLAVIGPMPCPVSRIANFHRVSVEVTGPRRGVVQEALMRVRAQGLLKSDSRTAVDVDPIALM